MPFIHWHDININLYSGFPHNYNRCEFFHLIALYLAKKPLLRHNAVTTPC